MIPACIFPSPTSVILVLLCCGYYSIQIFYQLEISKDTNIRNFCPVNYQRRDFWPWYGFDFGAGLILNCLSSKSPTPGFLADFLILFPLFRISGSALVWTLVVDCGGLAWPGSKYHRCWTWIPPGGWSYVLLPARLFWEISVCQPQPITSYCQTSPRQDLRNLWMLPIPSSMSS